jgi:hypothetical protein
VGLARWRGDGRGWFDVTFLRLLEGKDKRLTEWLEMPSRLFEPDQFDLFPSSIAPRKLCVVMGGTGARSFLHADPYEWTGEKGLWSVVGGSWLSPLWSR